MAIRISSLATLGQPPAFFIAVTIIVNFTADIEHHLPLQTLAR